VLLIDWQLAAAELPELRPAGAQRLRAAALKSPSEGAWVEGRREGGQHQLLNGRDRLVLPGATGVEQGRGGLHRRKEKKRPHSRPFRLGVIAARCSANRELALALSLTR
jgi:hypothetical protein